MSQPENHDTANSVEDHDEEQADKDKDESLDSTHVNTHNAAAPAVLSTEPEQEGPDWCFSSGLFESAVPEQCLKGEVIMGIDEAGRGPVLGPMTYGAAYWSMNDDEAIKKLGYDDSKALSEDKREKLYKGIMAEQRIGWVLRVLGARELSARMLRRAPHSLNAISHAAAAEMIRHALGRAVALTHVYVDTVGDPDNYARALRREFPGIGFTVAKKADSLYKTVSAASICAKVVRDRALARWRYREPGVFAGDAAARAYGSGYPGDARCSAWLRSHVDNIFGYPDVARFSWSTARDLLEAAAAKVEWEEEEEGDVQGGFGGPQGAPKLDAFFTRSGQAPRTQYFKRARIERTYAF